MELFAKSLMTQVWECFCFQGEWVCMFVCFWWFYAELSRGTETKKKHDQEEDQVEYLDLSVHCNGKMYLGGQRILSDVILTC